jgi:enediyne biosynthesis protein E4
MNFPRRTFLGSSLVLLGERLSEALTTPLWRWTNALLLETKSTDNSVSSVRFVDVAAEAGLNVANV